MSLIVGGLVVPVLAALDLAQTYEPMQAASVLRMMSGAGRKQTQWQGKVRTRISGGGWIPLGLQSLDYSAAMQIACIAPRAIDAPGNVIVLPAARRADAGYTPRGYALLASGLEVETPVALVGNTATLTAVAGAASYQARYWPLLTVFAEPPTQNGDVRSARHSWELTAEEV